MKPPSGEYLESFRASRSGIMGRLRDSPPVAVARELQEAGWPREWACDVVREIEWKYNPAGLPDARRNQEIRASLQSRALFGAIIFILGLLVSFGPPLIRLLLGWFTLVAYGAVVAGAVMCVGAYQELKRHPDRPLPEYDPPGPGKPGQPGTAGCKAPPSANDTGPSGAE